jgi:hypothetical protein
LSRADVPQKSRPLAGIGPAYGFNRVRRGVLSWLVVPVFPAARLLPSRADQLDNPDRESDGLTIVLTGIQGRSLLEQQIALGIADAGVPGRIEIVDWTTGNPLRFLQHLRARDRASEAGLQLAERITAYRREHPNRPVNIVGYSGGGFVVLLALEALPADIRVTRAVLLAPSCSPYLDVVPLATKTEAGLIHFRSPFDIAVLGALTAVVGTTDGWHSPSAGLVGFHPEGLVLPGEDPTVGAGSPDVSGRFRELTYRFRWLRQFHYGGHFGYANRVWACETLGRLLAGGGVEA